MNRTLLPMPRHLFKRPFLAVALAGLGTVALAQSQPPMSMPDVSAPATAAHPLPGQWREHMVEHHAHLMAHLKKALKIMPSQSSAWDQFEAAMQPPPPPSERPQPGAWAKLTTPERIDRMEQRADQRLQRMKARGDAVKALYAQLTPAQQKIFDECAQHFVQARARHMKEWAWRHDGHGFMHHHPDAPAAASSQAN
ncbi:MAG: Spy/CpxP family protein refolding chaperone [Burkholderiaceae bacterium]|jgi:hypothetical protein|nr:Spy/CpxP family protein refolding chaperone [Burkholderiaceae bacterium]